MKNIVPATIQEVVLFKVSTCTDLTEGRGYKLIGYYLREDDAKEDAKGKGVWGGNATIEMITKRIVIIGGSLSWTDEQCFFLGEEIQVKVGSDHKAVQSAMAKLSKAELAAMIEHARRK